MAVALILPTAFAKKKKDVDRFPDGTEIPENTICIVTKVQGNTLEIKPKQN